MKVRLLAPANIDLEEAIYYYDHQLPGLGFRFFQEVNAAIERVKFLPLAWAKTGKRTRRCLVNGFPYAVMYVKDSDEIVITAIAHLHRNPDRYKDRIR